MRKITLNEEERKYILDNCFIMDDTNLASSLGMAKTTMYIAIKDDERFHAQYLELKSKRRSEMFLAKYKRALAGDTHCINYYTHNNKLSIVGRDNLRDEDLSNPEKIEQLLLRLLCQDENLTRKEAIQLLGITQKDKDVKDIKDTTKEILNILDNHTDEELLAKKKALEQDLDSEDEE